MKKYQFKLFALIILVFIFSVICSFGKEKDYYPLGIGARWDYSINVMNPSGVFEGKSVMRIEGIEEIEAKLPSGDMIKEKFFKSTILFSGIPGMDNEIEYYRKFEEGIYYVSDRDINRNLRLMLPLPIEIGKTWEETEDGDTYRIESIETLEQLDEEGNKRKYKNCLTVNGTDYGFPVTDYYVPDIGLLKRVVDFSGSGKTGAIEIVFQKYSKGKAVRLEIKSIQEMIEKQMQENMKELIESYLNTSSLRVNSWKISTIGEEKTDFISFPNMYKKREELEKQLSEHVEPTLNANDALWAAKEKLNKARTANEKMETQKEVDIAQEQYDNERKIHKQFQNTLAQAKKILEEEEEIVEFSLGRGNIPNLYRSEGQVKHVEVLVEISSTEGKRKYNVHLRKYILKDATFDAIHRARWIIYKFELVD